MQGDSKSCILLEQPSGYYNSRKIHSSEVIMKELRDDHDWPGNDDWPDLPLGTEELSPHLISPLGQPRCQSIVLISVF